MERARVLAHPKLTNLDLYCILVGEGLVRPLAEGRSDYVFFNHLLNREQRAGRMPRLTGQHERARCHDTEEIPLDLRPSAG